MATPGLLKIKIFWKKSYDVIINVYDVTNKILSSDSNYIVDAVMWPKFGNHSISMREVIIISILWRFDQKNRFFEGWSWFRFNNLGLALGMNLKFYTSMAKSLKLKVRNFWGASSSLSRVTGEKLVGGAFCLPPPPILNRVNGTTLTISQWCLHVYLWELARMSVTKNFKNHMITNLIIVSYELLRIRSELV